MTKAEEARLKQLVAAPLFRCSRGWRRGSLTISHAQARRLVALGIAERTISRKGTPMLVKARGRPKPPPPQLPKRDELWWIDG